MRNPTAERIYPTLPEESTERMGSDYRLDQISQCRKYLEDERDKRLGLYKKYKRAVNAMDTIDTGLTIAVVATTGTGIGLLSTIVAAPIAVGLGIAGVVCGLLGVAGKYTSRRLSKKVKKHDSVRVLADAKLNTISELVSTALIDGTISNEEFKLVFNEVKRYEEMKNDIRARSLKAIQLSEENKKTLVNQGREEAMQELKQKLTA